jgi:glycosyltransferase involved in cell wall biosynthesis
VSSAVAKPRPIRRVLWLVTRLAQSGGGERLALEGAAYFEQVGVATTIVALEHDPAATFDAAYRARVISLGGPRRHARGGRGVVDSLLWSARTAFSLYRLTRRVAPDLLLAQSENSSVVVYGLSALTRVPYAVLVFGDMFKLPEDHTKYALIFRRHFRAIWESKEGYQQIIPRRPPPGPLRQRLAREALALGRWLGIRGADAIFALSPSARWQVRKLYGRDSVVQRAAFPARLLADTRAPAPRRAGSDSTGVVLTISRLVMKKRVDLCLCAFAIVGERDPGLRLVVGGSGPDEPRLRHLARCLGIANRVEFAGHVPDAELHARMASCDLFVQLDAADWSIVGYEALALGRKVLFSVDAEIDPFVWRTGLVFTARANVRDAARGMAAALAAEARPLTADDRAALKEYTWERYFSRILAHSARAVSGHSSAG